MKNLSFIKTINCLLLLFFVISSLFAVNFSEINLSSDDRLLFKADFEGQHALFISRLTDMSMQQLTAFPEKMYLVNNGRTIIALNRFGAAAVPVSGGLPSPIKGFPSFTDGNIPLKGRLQDIAASSDGRWIIYIEPVSPGFGNLILINITSGLKKTVSEKIELPDMNFPVKWSPDSRLFVYEKGGRLFYFPILDDISVLIDERFRMIGQGGITSVTWGSHGDFYYLTGSTLYRVINPELFTRTIYGDFLSIGSVAAILPFDFNPGFDHFWIAPDSGSILINKGSKSFFFFMLGENRNNVSRIFPVPYGAENFNVIWPSEGYIAVSYTLQNKINFLLYSIKDSVYLTPSTNPSLPSGAISPDGSKAVFWGEGGLELWDYANWRLIRRLSGEKIISCAWSGDELLLTGTSSLIEEINISSSAYTRRVICLAGADESGFEESVRGQARVAAKSGNRWYVSDGFSWIPSSNVQLRPVFLSSDRYRVFLEPQSSGYFKNSLMVRNMQSANTSSLMSKHTANNSYKLSRRPVQTALCFDLYDDDTGLQQILRALRRYNIRATFFLNGEFIRRNPDAASAIAQAGHETASMFYAPIDLSDTRYRITREFITQGLARNEDEFYRATGKELSILWHPPFYRTSNFVNTAATSAGYKTVTRSYDAGDWISANDLLRLNLRQIMPSEMIEEIIKNIETDFVIPIRLGLLHGGRDEYLFQRIEVLLDALLRSGYVIVPVSNIIR
ncbi:MAG: polysaccharide deacetylase family protein [Treponema sp.]|nr:polysaccharide deacetylase family protein [Treponema sp.]